MLPRHLTPRRSTRLQPREANAQFRHFPPAPPERPAPAAPPLAENLSVIRAELFALASRQGRCTCGSSRCHGLGGAR